MAIWCGAVRLFNAGVPAFRALSGLWAGIALVACQSAALHETSGAVSTPPPVTENTAREICGDGLDNDGNGRADEGCQCRMDSQQACWLSSPIVGNAFCHGVQKCESSGEANIWGGCRIANPCDSTCVRTDRGEPDCQHPTCAREPECRQRCDELEGAESDCFQRLDLELVLDQSGSMGDAVLGADGKAPAPGTPQTKLDYLKRAVHDLISLLEHNGGVGRKGDHCIGITVFPSTRDAVSVKPLRECASAPKLREAIDAMAAGASTTLTQALAQGRNDMLAGQRSGAHVRRTLVLLSDGEVSGAIDEAFAEMYRDAADDAYALTLVGAGEATNWSDPQVELMRRLSKGAEGTHARVVRSPRDLHGIFTDVVSDACGLQTCDSIQAAVH